MGKCFIHKSKSCHSVTLVCCLFLQRSEMSLPLFKPQKGSVCLKQTRRTTPSIGKSVRLDGQGDKWRTKEESLREKWKRIRLQLCCPNAVGRPDSPLVGRILRPLDLYSWIVPITLQPVHWFEPVSLRSSALFIYPTSCSVLILGKARSKTTLSPHCNKFKML